MNAPSAVADGVFLEILLSSSDWKLRVCILQTYGCALQAGAAFAAAWHETPVPTVTHMTMAACCFFEGDEWPIPSHSDKQLSRRPAAEKPHSLNASALQRRWIQVRVRLEGKEKTTR